MSNGYEVGELLRAKPWLRFTPNDIRDGAVLDLVDAENAMQKKAKLARERGESDFQRWTLTPKEKNDPSGWTVKVQHRYIEKAEALPRPTAKAVTVDAHNPNAKRRNWTRITMFSRSKLADGKPLGAIWLSEDLVGKFGPISRDCRLTRDRRGKFHLHVPVTTPLPPTVPEAQREPCALDPGVRTFQAVHSRTGHGTYADGDFEPSGWKSTAECCITYRVASTVLYVLRPSPYPYPYRVPATPQAQVLRALLYFCTVRSWLKWSSPTPGLGLARTATEARTRATAKFDNHTSVCLLRSNVAYALPVPPIFSTTSSAAFRPATAITSMAEVAASSAEGQTTTPRGILVQHECVVPGGKGTFTRATCTASRVGTRLIPCMATDRVLVVPQHDVTQGLGGELLRGGHRVDEGEVQDGVTDSRRTRWNSRAWRAIRLRALGIVCPPPSPRRASTLAVGASRGRAVR